MASGRIINWDKTQSWNPDAIYYPEDEEQVAQLVRRALEDGKRIKAVGSALSWSDIADMPEIALRFDNMSGIPEVDRDNRRIRLQAGARLNNVNDLLARHGLAFDNFGSIVLQTAAGYIGTGTHGTGIRTPILSSYVEKIRLVDGMGEIHELDATREPELFSAARVNLGCLGIITEITFKCVEAFDLEERLELIDFDKGLADLDSYLKNNDYCKLWWLPYTDKLQLYAFNKTDKPRGGFGFTGFMDKSGASGVLFSGLLKLSRAAPRIIPLLHDTTQKIHFHPRRRVDRSDLVIKVSNSIPLHQEAEHAIPVENAAKAIDEMRRFILNAKNYRVNFPMEIRFVAADDIPMSPASARDSCYLGAYVASVDWAKPYFADFEEFTRDYRGRPHWGKSFSHSAKEIRALYPAYDEFNQLRQNCDPRGVFRNSFVDRVFPKNLS